VNFSNSLAAQIKALKGGTFISDSFDRLMNSVTAGYNVQHNTDDTHATITATGSISERGRTVPMGEWVNPTFDASWFTVGGAGNSWVVSPPTLTNQFYVVSYMLVGKTMFFNLNIFNSTLTVATAITTLSVAMPPGFRVAGALTNLSSRVFVGRQHDGGGYVVNGGTQKGALLETGAGDVTVTIRLASGGFFVDDSGGSFTVSGQIFIEVEQV
jgi:hypothetical protein